MKNTEQERLGFDLYVQVLNATLIIDYCGDRVILDSEEIADLLEHIKKAQSLN